MKASTSSTPLLHHIGDVGTVWPCTPTAPLATIASVLVVEQDADHDEVLGERLDVYLLVDRPDPGHLPTILTSSLGGQFSMRSNSSHIRFQNSSVSISVYDFTMVPLATPFLNHSTTSGAKT